MIHRRYRMGSTQCTHCLEMLVKQQNYNVSKKQQQSSIEFPQDLDALNCDTLQGVTHRCNYINSKFVKGWCFCCIKPLDCSPHSVEGQAFGLRHCRLERRRGPGQRGRRATGDGRRTQYEVTVQLFLLCLLHGPMRWRPESDYCAGIQAQSVFIGVRAKIIQEGSGPLIHFKRQMKGGAGGSVWGGGRWGDDNESLSE